MTTASRPALQQRSMSLSRFVIYGLLILFAAIFLIPVYMVLMTGFKNPAEVSISTMWQFPSSFSLESYGQALQVLAPGLTNSFLLVIPATILSSVLGSLNGYVLSKWRFPGANILFPLMLFGMFIPYQAILIPLVQFLSSIGLYDSLPGLILVHVVYGLPITTLVFRNYYAEVPNEMLEAGAIDGCGFFGLYWHVVLPLSLPGFVVVIIWQFTQIWNEFLFGVTVAQGTPTVTVALQNLSGSQIVQWNVQMAAALLAALPTLVVYILLGRYFIRGLLAGSVKG
ncbi:MAG: carbohydrate ABC transporter permease [Chloroflexi bacterium]|nr:MAG: binding-protein-dependent transport system inner membrane protein [Chloroflexi bacterium OLB13]MBC6954915.1 carbohydrate ABC transporter permease [Chloroflexota bacterium]MBV6437447.1 Inner membrane ABC transporter permease protein YcjP [Anaerolineae bacterium]MDL1916605.1 carbohydrate ABC transporter permease [Anaerolineae bacterium CFX4]OQY79966.1 MAG: ABC transporter permease [Anaerolineae bacterium UTCFX5]